ncbi:MAG TPA: hypothetical protein VF181_09175 [Balneolaceae bacterium]
MKKSIKYTLLLLATAPLLFAGCESLFNKGDVEKVYTGPDLVEFKPLTTEMQIVVDSLGNHSGGVAELKVQLISAEGLAESDVAVSFSVDGSSTATDGHYNLSATSVTIPSGSATTSFTITVPSDANIAVGDEFTVILNMGEVSGAVAAENLDQAIVYIQGVEPEEE